LTPYLPPLGRFGSFIENLRLPRDADLDSLEATYEGGVLRIIVPKERVRRPPPGRYAAPHTSHGRYPPHPHAHPRAARPHHYPPQHAGLGAPGFGDFFQDRDFWM
jgi:hypothetical protein